MLYFAAASDAPEVAGVIVHSPAETVSAVEHRSVTLSRDGCMEVVHEVTSKRNVPRSDEVCAVHA